MTDVTAQPFKLRLRIGCRTPAWEWSSAPNTVGPRPARRAASGSCKPGDVITRTSGYLQLRRAPAPAASHQLEQDGLVILPGVFSPDEIGALGADVERVFAELPPDERLDGWDVGHWAPFRYEMLNRSEVCQRAIAHPAILDVVEPLLGEDCHVIANTAWRQPEAVSSHGGQFWHIDSGPHVPRDPDVPWDPRIPYPISRSPPISSSGTPRSGRGRPPSSPGATGRASHRPSTVSATSTSSGTAAAGSRRWRLPATSPSSCPTSGTVACRRRRTGRGGSSCSATTAGATWPSASARRASPTTCRPRQSPGPAPNASGRSSACTGRCSTTAENPRVQLLAALRLDFSAFFAFLAARFSWSVLPCFLLCPAGSDFSPMSSD